MRRRVTNLPPPAADSRDTEAGARYPRETGAPPHHITLSNRLTPEAAM